MRNLLTCLLLLAVSTLFAQPTFTVSSGSGSVGDVVHIQVTVNDLGSVDGLEATLGWDASKLELNQATDVYHVLPGSFSSFGYTRAITHDFMSMTAAPGLTFPPVPLNVPDGYVLFEGDFTILDDSTPEAALVFLNGLTINVVGSQFSTIVNTLIRPDPTGGTTLNHGAVTIIRETPVPTMGQWGLMILALLMSCTSVIYIGKQQLA